MIETFRRSTLVVAWSIGLASLACVTAARAQSAPGAGVQSMGPASPVPDLPPSAFGAPSVSGPSDAPLASSTQSCQTDISRISSERMAAIEALNKIAKANKGKLDPIAACPRFRSLVKIEDEFRDYLIKNKDWCGVPDNIVSTVQESTAKDTAVSDKACELAVQFRKEQQQAALGLAAQAPKLPAGPL
jgi:hypothetical protein